MLVIQHSCEEKIDPLTTLVAKVVNLFQTKQEMDGYVGHSCEEKIDPLTTLVAKVVNLFQTKQEMDGCSSTSEVIVRL